VPIVAVGGITKDDVSNIIKTGISGIAVSGAILNSKNIEEEAQLFLRNIKLELKNIKL
jgi:thiamine-phosphate pyrophosphorylase